MEQVQQKTVLLVGKAGRDDVRELADVMACWLAERGYGVVRVHAQGDDPVYGRTDFGLAVVLGGDGTLLGVARRLARHPVPILGINFGRVGFLTVTPPEEWRGALEAVLAGRGYVQERMALQWQVRRAGESFGGMAVNDVVVCRGAVSRVSTLDVFAGDQFVASLRADGLIVSSPMGSSAYTVSAGGPLVHPAVEALVLTPICPFLNRMPPVVLPAAADVRILLRDGSVETCLTADGQDGACLKAGDEVRVRAVPGGVRLVSASPDRYFDRLGRRGFLGPGGTR